MRETERIWKSRPSACGTMLLLFLLAVPEASGQELTGTLYGKVTAEDGALLPGVTVTVTGPRLIKGSEFRVTNEGGMYRIPALPPGTYEVTAELPGFQTASRAGIVLTAGASLSVDLRLVIAGVQETVTVTGDSPLVDVRSAQTTRTVEQSVIENAPVGRTSADLITTAPGVIDSGYSFAPAQSVHGSSVRDNVYNVDGAVTNDSTVGYMATQIPFDVIGEVQVTSGGISAEFGQASGAVFNFITKSGGNDFSGGGSVFLRNDALEWDNLTSELASQGLEQGTSVKKDLDYAFNLGGPIRRNKLWFFGNVRWLGFERSSPEFPALNPTVDERQAFLKLTSQIASASTLQGSYTRVNREEYPSNASFRTTDAPETWERGLRDQHIIYLSLTHVLSDSTFTDVQFGQTLVDLDSEHALDAVGSQDITSGLFFGGWTGTAGKSFQRDKRTIKASVSHFVPDWLGGTHSFKTGFYHEFSPFARVRDIYGDTFQLFRTGAPYRVRLYNTPRTPRTNVTALGAYIQDEWTIRDRVTLNLGLRFESTEGWQPAQESGGGRWFELEQFDEQRDQIKWFNVAPRFGFVWDVTGDKRTSVKLSVGRYYNTLLNQHVLVANRGQAGYQEFDWADTNGDRSFQTAEQRTLRNDTRASLDDFDPNLRQPYTDSVHLGVDRSLGQNFVISLAGIYKRERDMMESINQSIPFSAYNPITAVNPLNGEPLTIFAQDVAFQGVQRVRLLTNPNDPVRLKRDYYGVEIVARRRMSEQWQFQGSLNLGRSEGNIGNSFDSTSGLTRFYDDPNTLINSEGPLDLDTPVQAKLQGTYLAPYDVALSAYYVGISGFPEATTVRFSRENHPEIVVESFIEVAGEKRGSYRYPFRHLLSFRAEKELGLGGNRKLGLVADFFNLLNVNTVTSVQTFLHDHPNYLKPAVIEPPRAVRLGARFSF